MAEPFKFPNGQLAHNVEDLIKICEKSPTDAIYHLMRADFENWLNYIGETKFAQIAKQARLASASDEQRLQQFLKSCQTSYPQPSNAKQQSIQQPISSNSQPNQDNDGNNPLSNFFKALGRLFARA